MGLKIIFILELEYFWDILQIKDELMEEWKLF